MALNASGMSGVPRYTAALCRALDAISGELSDIELELVTTAAGAEAIGARSLPMRRLGSRRGGAMTRPVRLVAEQLTVPGLAADVIHYFDVGGPLLTRGRRFVFTFHDASVCKPDTSHFGRMQRARKLRQIPWSFTRAAAVVAVSDFAKKEAVHYFGAQPGKVTVLHSGPGLLSERNPVPEQPSDSQPFVLFVGSLTASKNVPFLVRAFDRAEADVDLVLAGRAVDDADSVRAAIRASRVPERIRLVEPSDAELDRLYRDATAFAFPSLYEGFGFPPLEAMARDCPVLASDIPALREISGEGAMLLPLDEVVWADSLRRVVSDPRVRDELRERGRRTVARYSWERTARELCGVLLRAAADSET